MAVLRAAMYDSARMVTGLLPMISAGSMDGGSQGLKEINGISNPLPGLAAVVKLEIVVVAIITGCNDRFDVQFNRMDKS